MRDGSDLGLDPLNLQLQAHTRRCFSAGGRLLGSFRHPLWGWANRVSSSPLRPCAATTTTMAMPLCAPGDLETELASQPGD
jgi:hypothetical protein